MIYTNQRRYIVLRPFINRKLGWLTTGHVIPHYNLKYLSEKEYKNIFIQEWDKNWSAYPFSYGLIFLSKEIKFPEGGHEETRDEMIEKLKCDMKACCESGEEFLNDD